MSAKPGWRRGISLESIFGDVDRTDPRNRSKDDLLTIHSNFFMPSDEGKFHGFSWRRRWVTLFLQTRMYEGFISGIIMFNFILTCVETDATAAGISTSDWVHQAMTICFVSVIFEFCLNVYAHRSTILGNVFTWLDIVILLAGAAEYILKALDSNQLDALPVIRILRVVRLFRLVRIVRHIKSCRELTRLVQMMGCCFRTLFWSFILLGFFMTIWGTIAVEMIQPVIVELRNQGYWEGCDRCGRSFASVWDANLTLFQTIVAGDSWGIVAVPVIEHKPWTAVVFLGSFLTLVFGVLNLALAVVVDTSSEERKKDVVQRGLEMEADEFEEKKSLARIFHLLDFNQSGGISYTEMCRGARRIPELRHWFRILDIDTSELKDLFQFLDADDDGEINPSEFIEQLWRMKNTESKTSARLVKEIVRRIHIDQAVQAKALEKRFREVYRKIEEFENVQKSAMHFLAKCDFGQDLSVLQPVQELVIPEEDEDTGDEDTPEEDDTVCAAEDETQLANTSTPPEAARQLPTHHHLQELTLEAAHEPLPGLLGDNVNGIFPGRSCGTPNEDQHAQLPTTPASSCTTPRRPTFPSENSFVESPQESGSYDTMTEFGDPPTSELTGRGCNGAVLPDKGCTVLSGPCPRLRGPKGSPSARPEV